MNVSPALRIAGQGLVAAGVLAAGVALGAVAERSLLRGRSRVFIDEEGEAFGELRGTESSVPAADGTALHVEIDDADPDLASPAGITVIFCHGYALNLDSWHYQRRALRGRARLVFYDQRSHGRSQHSDFDTHHIDQLGIDLGSVIDAVAPDGPLLLVGHSMGGMTIMALADQRPELFDERVYGAALISTTAGGLSRGTFGLPARLGAAVHRVGPSVAAALVRQRQLVERSKWNDSDLGLLITRLYSFGSPTPDEAGRFVAGMVSATPIDVIAEFLPALEEHDKQHALHVLEHVELLVLVGDSDRLTPRAQSEEIVAALPGAEFVVVPNAGHMVTIERHDVVDEHLLALLDRVERDVANHGEAVRAGGAA